LSLFQGIRYFLLADNNKNKTLQLILGFYPKNQLLYEQAFRHKSVANEQVDESIESNERLEFLGDAILGAIIAEYVFIKFPYKDEGFLTKLRSKMVSRSFLNQLAVDIGLDTFIETSPNVNRSNSINGDAFEALIGAIYLDKGYDASKKFVVEKIIKDFIDIKKLIKEESNYKSKLIEWAQSEKLEHQFDTTLIDQTKIKYFKCELKLNNTLITIGEGSSKKKAEQAAAKKFFAQKSHD